MIKFLLNQRSTGLFLFKVAVACFTTIESHCQRMSNDFYLGYAWNPEKVNFKPNLKHQLNMGQNGDRWCFLKGVELRILGKCRLLKQCPPSTTLGVAVEGEPCRIVSCRRAFENLADPRIEIVDDSWIRYFSIHIYIYTSHIHAYIRMYRYTHAFDCICHREKTGDTHAAYLRACRCRLL